MIGTTHSHYRIVEHLGGGGMGVVYKAEDTKLGRTVALKFLPPEWSRDPDARERFLREARAASALEDSRICTIFDIDETEDGQLFIAMACYEGETLKKRIERGRLPVGEAIDIAIQVAEGLERAHSAEILHRDIKPANLMLTGHDEVVIVDFGLAKLAGDFTLTKPGSSLGTPHYMSPEQSRGQPLDARTDLWSLGVVLYEMLTGGRPFAGENHTSVARAILDDEVPEIRNIRPDAPPELGAIVAKALEKDADRRYQSAGHLLANLRSLRNQMSEFEGLTLSVPSRASSRRRLPLALVFVATALVLGTAAAIWYLGPGGSCEPIDAPPPRIVVLPFENLGSPEDEYFADGITEEITSRLATVSGLQVISRTSAMHYKGRRLPLKQIGEELNVGFVLEGTIRWDRNREGHGRVRVTPQLINVEDDSHLWTDRYDRVLEDIFWVQTEIGEQVIANLQVAILEPERRRLESLPTDSTEAHQAYLLGMHFMFEQREFWKSLEMFQLAVELDPDFALAYARLAHNHSALYHYRKDFTPERLELAKAAADRSLELQPDLSQGHQALGRYFYHGCRNYEKALEQFRIAVNLHPGNHEAIGGIFAVTRRMGRWDEALEALEAFLALDPQHYDMAVEAAQTYKTVRDFPRAESELLRAMKIKPDNDRASYVLFQLYPVWEGTTDQARAILERARSQGKSVEQLQIVLDLYDRKPQSALARLDDLQFQSIDRQLFFTPRALLECMCLAEAGDAAQAMTACSSAEETLRNGINERPNDHRLYLALGQALALLGRNEEAMIAGERGAEMMPIATDALDGSYVAIDLAKIYSRVGESEKALDLIEELLSIPCDLSVGLLRLDPVWDPLRDHPRFQVLLEKYEVEQ